MALCVVVKGQVWTTSRSMHGERTGVADGLRPLAIDDVENLVGPARRFVRAAQGCRF